MRGRGATPDSGPDPFADGLPTLDGARVRLRQPVADDVPALLAVFGDPETLRYWSHGPLRDLSAARTYLEGIESGLRDRRLFQWAITEPGADRLVGTVTLIDWDRDHRRAEVGFILHPSRWGQGLASDAVRTVLRFGFEDMDLHRVEADVDPDNGASMRLLERLGFRREGHFRERWFTFGSWKDSAMYGLLAADFVGDPTGKPAAPGEAAAG